ncbi:MAG: UDP-4-amino-4,6-dideoxy-N-acetyl-beta-L-altrosamine transaminase [Deltaproteobacteria bacterium]|nr:UDP-4-amino-4,6-dideoxy-N-acetyl-beta-L-altrosamine transaminase [Deltaproteobacteria bacterium]
MIPYGKQAIGDDDIRAVVEVLHSDWITTGPKIAEFEQDLCRYTGCRHAAAVNSGTSALDIAVQSLSLTKGSEVITTPFTFVASSNCLLYNGLKPVWAEITRDTRNIDPEDIRRKITNKTKAILFVDFAGHPCDIKELKEIAEENNLYLIQDACHSLGAEYQGRKIGTQSDLTVLSFHPVKHITTGEGGAVLTDDQNLHERLLLLRSHGIDRDARSRYGPEASWAYDMKELGRNYRITDIQAALGITQLKKLDGFVEKRIDIARKYVSALKDVSWISLPVTHPNVKHSWHLFTIILADHVKRDEFFTYMRRKNIGVNVHYIPVYHHTYYRKTIPVNDNDFPVTEDVFNRIISLPMYPGITDDEFSYVVDTITSFR